jgi:hypothetical protein
MSSIDIRQQAIALLDQLPQNKLVAVVQLLEILAEPTAQTSASPEEARLLEVIQHHLPESEQARLDDLRGRCEWGELSETEYQELIRYEDQLEQHRVERLEALMELAKLRNLDLVSLNRQLSAQTQPFNAA